MRYYETFYGIHANDWTETFGSFANHHKLLVKNYISGGTDTQDSSTASETHKFLYPQHIKKTYFIEGVITGQITFESSTATGYLCAYRVTLCKVHENTDEDELFSTGWQSVNHVLGWDAVNGVPGSKAGEMGSVVYPFWIDAWTKAELGENERLYLKVESTCTDDGNFEACSALTCDKVELWHSNDASWEDVKVTIPFRM